MIREPSRTNASQQLITVALGANEWDAVRSGAELDECDIIERSVLTVVGPAIRVYVTDGNAFFKRSGPHIVESLEIMAACVHPELLADFTDAYRAVIERVA